MKKIFIAVLLLALTNTMVFAAKTLNEENISKMLDKVIIAKEHKNIKSMRKHFLSRTSINLTNQDIDTVKTYRYTFNEYKRHLSKKWKKVQSNLIKIGDRKFNIDKNGKSALVKTTLTQTIEIEGIKMQTTIYETTAISLIKGKIYINYYSARKMLNTSVKVN